MQHRDPPTKGDRAGYWAPGGSEYLAGRPAPRVTRMDAPGAETGYARKDAPPMYDPRQGPPRVSDHLVEPETDFEVLDGEVRACLPANPPHSVQHTTVTSVLNAYKAGGYLVDTDLLTRVSGDSNFASDCCVRKAALDPASGDRCLEEFVVEIKDTQRAADLDRRAAAMTRAGVRRIFAIPIKGDRVGRNLVADALLEWQAETKQWKRLAADAVLRDPCLREPLPAKALLSAVEADTAVARAVLASGHPEVLEHNRGIYRDGYRTGKDDGYRAGKDHGYRAGEDHGYRAGTVEGLRQAVLMLLGTRGFDTGDVRARVEECTDAALLARWLQRVADARDLGDVFGDA